MGCASSQPEDVKSETQLIALPAAAAAVPPVVESCKRGPVVEVRQSEVERINALVAEKASKGGFASSDAAMGKYVLEAGEAERIKEQIMQSQGNAPSPSKKKLVPAEAEGVAPNLISIDDVKDTIAVEGLYATAGAGEPDVAAAAVANTYEALRAAGTLSAAEPRKGGKNGSGTKAAAAGSRPAATPNVAATEEPPSSARHKAGTRHAGKHATTPKLVSSKVAAQSSSSLQEEERLSRQNAQPAQSQEEVDAALSMARARLATTHAEAVAQGLRDSSSDSSAMVVRGAALQTEAHGAVVARTSEANLLEQITQRMSAAVGNFMQTGAEDGVAAEEGAGWLLQQQQQQQQQRGEKQQARGRGKTEVLATSAHGAAAGMEATKRRVHL